MAKLSDGQMRGMLGNLDARCIRCGKKMSTDELMEGQWASRSGNPFDDVICKDCLTDEEKLEAQVNEATVDLSIGFDAKLKATGPFVLPELIEWLKGKARRKSKHLVRVAGPKKRPA